MPASCLIGRSADQKPLFCARRAQEHESNDQPIKLSTRVISKTF